MVLIDRLELLLDGTFIHYAADCYQWALDSENELNTLDDDYRKEVLVYYRGDDYKTKAELLVNQEYQKVLKDKGLAPIGRIDLERCWYLTNRMIPRDPLGLIYSWFSAHSTMYIPDRFGRALRPLEAANKDDALEVLFNDFMHWAEVSGNLNILSFKPGDPAYIDEIDGIFKMTVKVLTTNNAYLRQLFDRLDSSRVETHGQTTNIANKAN